MRIFWWSGRDLHSGLTAVILAFYILIVVYNPCFYR